MVAAIIEAPKTQTFDEVFANEYERVVNVAYRVVADAGEAEDVAQEVFAAFARSHRSAERARGWLLTAAVHTALNHARSRKRRTQHELKDFRLRHAVHDGTHSLDPQNILERAHAQSLVRTAMLRLRVREAQLLALRYSGFSYREIADALRIDPAQIGSCLARAQRAFKKEIERETLG